MQDLDLAVDHLMCAKIVMRCRTVYIAIDVDVKRPFPCRIPCNKFVQRFPGGGVCTRGLASEGVQAV